MPHDGGWGFYHQCRWAGYDGPVVIIAASEAAEARRRLGAQAVLQEPVNIEALVEVVKQLASATRFLDSGAGRAGCLLLVAARFPSTPDYLTMSRQECQGDDIPWTRPFQHQADDAEPQFQQWRAFGRGWRGSSPRSRAHLEKNRQARANGMGGLLVQQPRRHIHVHGWLLQATLGPGCL
jgi:hypothetical protein